MVRLKQDPFGHPANPSQHMRERSVHIWIRFAAAILTVFSAVMVPETARASQTEPLPLYDCIAPNVSFWTDIYSKYASNQGVIHDKFNLAIVYEVIALHHPDLPGSRKSNSKRIRIVKDKYRAILAGLARRGTATSEEERRVADLFGAEATPADFKKAMHQLRCQVGQKDRFREGIIRSGAYLDQIQRIFHDHGLPEDLAYLPHVESSFNPSAYSKFGAAGIWQFTRSTGRRFMRVGYDVDERRDPILASHAAALLLKSNYRSLRNWPMAITAYNHGTGGMLRAKRLKGDYETIVTAYRSRLFRFASRNFYSEFLAAREVARNYRRYFGDLKLDPPAETRRVTLEGYAALHDLARHFGLEPAELVRLNPALRIPVRQGTRDVPPGYRLRLPAGAADGREPLRSVIPASLYRQAPQNSPVYTVRKGDTAGKIARSHGIALTDLIAANQLDRRATIRVNQQLRIPATAPGHRRAAPGRAALATVFEAPAGNQSPPAPEKIDPFRPAAGAHLSDPASIEEKMAVRRIGRRNNQPVGTIHVEAEETLGHYAEWLEVTAGRIRRLNGFRYDRPLRLAENIIVPLVRVSAETFARRRLEYHQQLAEDFFAAYRIDKMITYSIRRGDTIWSLSREQFEVPIWLLVRCNTGVNLASLTPETTLRIPVLRENV
jgi:membrane-bound lytic murein transglycosylase D